MIRTMKLMALGMLVIGGLLNTTIYSIQSIKFIGQASIGTTGYTITTTGLYVLTEDVSFASSGTAITIASDNVTLDLNNKYVLGSTLATGILVSGSHKNITVRNGTVSGFGVAGFDGETGGILVQQLSLQNLNFTHGDVSPSGTGILIHGNNIEIDNCLTCSFNIGTRLDSCMEVSITNLISNFNSFSTGAAKGLYLNTCTDVSVRNSSFNKNSGSAVYALYVTSCSNIDVQDSHFDSNTSTNNENYAAFIDSSNVINIARCTFNRNSGGSGFNNVAGLGIGLYSASSDVYIVDCEASNNNAGAGTPFQVSGLETDTATNLYCRNCHFNGNSNASQVAGVLINGSGAIGVFESCEANNNVSSGSFGIGFWIAPGASAPFLIKDCLAQDNSGTTGSGFRFESGCTKSVIQNCKAINNSTNGFDDENATPQNWYAGNIAFGQGANNYSSIIGFVEVGLNAQPAALSFDERSIDNLSIN